MNLYHELVLFAVLQPHFLHSSSDNTMRRFMLMTLQIY
jgi:hypothetical protein